MINNKNEKTSIIDDLLRDVRNLHEKITNQVRIYHEYYPGVVFVISVDFSGLQDLSVSPSTVGGETFKSCKPEKSTPKKFGLKLSIIIRKIKN